MVRKQGPDMYLSNLEVGQEKQVETFENVLFTYIIALLPGYVYSAVQYFYHGPFCEAQGPWSTFGN